MADLSTFRQSDVFAQRNGKTFDDDETLRGVANFLEPQITAFRPLTYFDLLL
jgi:hypothetical protein